MATTTPTSTARPLRDSLRQMVALLQDERQALAGLDLEAIAGCAYDKHELCDALDGTEPEAIDAECKGLLEAARRLNEVNRQLRNLIAANISARLEALTGGVPRYRGAATGPAAAYAPAYAYAGNRG